MCCRLHCVLYRAVHRAVLKTAALPCMWKLKRRRNLNALCLPEVKQRLCVFRAKSHLPNWNAKKPKKIRLTKRFLQKLAKHPKKTAKEITVKKKHAIRCTLHKL